MDSKKILFNSPISHIYVEKDVIDNSLTKSILNKFKNANVIYINHYKDVFSRHKQNIVNQRQSQALIIAKKTGELIYKGSPMCQDFDNENFYYTSCVMNCIFDCEYCYLKGMYPSSNIVIFVNIDDIFNEVKALCKDKKIYLCVSYDTDLIALDVLTGFLNRWADLVSEEPNLTIEIRTKSHRKDIYDLLKPDSRMIFAYTISPQSVIDSYEHKTGSLKDRIEAVKKAMENGFTVRLCFDPMIYCRNFEKEYEEMFKEVVDSIDLTRVKDISIGSFRLSSDYLKIMRHKMPNSAICQFPFETNNGTAAFPLVIREKMEKHLMKLLTEYVAEDKIFRALD